MKVLRNWMRGNEKMREIFADTLERAIPSGSGDKMRDVIMVMADALEEIADYKKLCVLCESRSIIATTAREKIEGMVG